VAKIYFVSQILSYPEDVNAIKSLSISVQVDLERKSPREPQRQAHPPTCNLLFYVSPVNPDPAFFFIP
jgi:hypothetical protein